MIGPDPTTAPAPEAWRSAVDDLPPPNTLVLIWFPLGEVRVGHYSATAKKWCPPRRDRILRIQPTAWQPLPVGPGGLAPLTTPTGGE